MRIDTNLNRLEKRVFRMNFEDGLLDIYIGIFLIPFIIWAATRWQVSSFLPILLFPVLYPIYMLVKIKVIQPRIGAIKPGVSRKRRINFVVLTTVAAVATMVLIVILTATGQSMNLVIFLFIASAVVGSALAAWLLDTLRIAVYATLAVATISVDTFLLWNKGIFPITTVTALVMIGYGVYLFRRFLKRNPLPEIQEDHA